MVRDAPYGRSSPMRKDDQCNRNSPLIARSSARLDQLAVRDRGTECSGPSSFACQNSRNFCNSETSGTDRRPARHRTAATIGDPARVARTGYESSEKSSASFESDTSSISGTSHATEKVNKLF